MFDIIISHLPDFNRHGKTLRQTFFHSCTSTARQRHRQRGRGCSSRPFTITAPATSPCIRKRLCEIDPGSGHVASARTSTSILRGAMWVCLCVLFIIHHGSHQATEFAQKAGWVNANSKRRAFVRVDTKIRGLKRAMSSLYVQVRPIFSATRHPSSHFSFAELGGWG